MRSQPERKRSKGSKWESKGSPRSKVDKVDKLKQLSLLLSTKDESKRQWREDFFHSQDVSFASAKRRPVELQDEEWMKQKDVRGVIPAYSHAHQLKRPAK
jgi:hypothetical protein